MAGTPQGARKRGRYNEAARNDRAVLEAAREVFLTEGFDAPVSAIAERAGCGVGSLYRRYPTKEALLQRLCVLAMEQAVEAAEAGLRCPDPWTGLRQYIVDCVAFGSGALAPLAGRIATTPEMWETSERGNRVIAALVERARAGGALRDGVTQLDIALLIEQFSRRGSGALPADDDNNRSRLLAIALDGLRAHNTDPLPGHPPDPDAYAARWRRG
ncbi:MAG TPA: helix-turn-helix domain-containing protein [Pseudonocardia sp.]|jgi:AcrR family transcriptional regulator|uniref:TetR/AcrR family transcriptional regulator n=1 Tax=Pseudonocardia sp. TaxID=60912 RepID=UPI002B4B01E8|nr:helix-turn-helix domain-containing protein [Pseudonocardia sp.]HLU57697.1 helix-turn-helix domain-containing protein [Pseudonocardia sp.]